MSRIIIGLTGSFGSGCTTIAKYIQTQGFEYISLSQMLKNSFREEYGREYSKRRELQDYGNKIRQNKGGSFLAEFAYAYMEKECPTECWVVDGFKNPAEVEFFHSKCSEFYLLGIFADFDTRWKRVKDKYPNESQGYFTEDDKIDSNDDLEYGQRVKDCFLISDIIVSNNINFNRGSEDEIKFKEYINNFVKLITGDNLRIPTAEEALMATAYASSQRSSCSKRKVGAIIVDNYNNIFSSGHNDVPKGEKPCMKEYGKCYRDLIRESVKEEIDFLIDEEKLKNSLKKNVLSKYKMLDLCRALHAEEQAILNVARLGVSSALHESTLYTTTFPCNLCANKIAQVGIPKIVYLEPYPVIEAKEILTKHKIEQKPFEGVSFKGFFRLFGREVL